MFYVSFFGGGNFLELHYKFFSLVYPENILILIKTIFFSFSGQNLGFILHIEVAGAELRALVALGPKSHPRVAKVRSISNRCCDQSSF